MQLTESAYAKINLSLDVVNRRQDGYHNLCMVMQTVSLCDTLTVETCRGSGITLQSNAAHLPTDGRNLVVAAAQRFFADSGVDPCGLLICLEKRIPVAAGLAGGSTDAACMLRMLNRIFKTGYSADKLRTMALPLGADVPYCIEGGTVLAEGIGEVLTPVSSLPDCHILLCKPPFGVSTPAVFSRINWRQIVERPDTKGIIEALDCADLGGVARRMYNVLESVTVQDHPVISDIRRRMVDMGAMGSVMSGSGPTVIGIFDDDTAAQAAYVELHTQYAETFLIRPVGKQAV